MFIEKDCSFSALISDRVGCSGGLILNPSWVQQMGVVVPWRATADVLYFGKVVGIIF